MTVAVCSPLGSTTNDFCSPKCDIRWLTGSTTAGSGEKYGMREGAGMDTQTAARTAKTSGRTQRKPVGEGAGVTRSEAEGASLAADRGKCRVSEGDKVRRSALSGLIGRARVTDRRGELRDRAGPGWGTPSECMRF